MQKYPVKVQPDGGGYLATFRDIPEALAGGDTREGALAEAFTALIDAMDFYFEDERLVPKPSAAQDGEELLELPVSVATKVLLLNEMVIQKVRKGELAKRMDVRKQEVTRLFNLKHTTKIDTVQDAFKALGKTLEFRV